MGSTSREITELMETQSRTYSGTQHRNVEFLATRKKISTGQSMKIESTTNKN